MSKLTTQPAVDLLSLLEAYDTDAECQQCRQKSSRAAPPPVEHNAGHAEREHEIRRVAQREELVRVDTVVCVAVDVDVAIDITVRARGVGEDGEEVHPHADHHGEPVECRHPNWDMWGQEYRTGGRHQQGFMAGDTARPLYHDPLQTRFHVTFAV